MDSQVSVGDIEETPVIIMAASADELTDRQLLVDIWKDLKDVKSGQNFNSQDIKELQTQVKTLEIQNTQQEKRIDFLEAELATIKRAQLDEKAYSMRQNLLFDNVEYSKNENLIDKLRLFFRNELQIENAENIRFERVHRLGRQREGSPPITVVARFHAYTDRDLVWRSRARRPEGSTSKVYIREHYPEPIERNRRELMPIFREAKFHDKTTSMTKDAIIFRGRKYTVDNVPTLTQALPNNGKSIGIKSNDTVCAFLGKHCPLSNFNRCEIELAGKCYTSVKQGYQLAKAQYHGRDDVAKQIMSTADPLEIKQLGQALPNGEWYQSGEALKAMSG